MDPEQQKFAEALRTGLTRLGGERRDAFGPAIAGQLAVRKELEREAARIAFKFGSDHPRTIALRSALVSNRALIHDLSVEMELAHIEVPEVDEDDALLHGRVMDPDKFGIRGLVACLVDDTGKPVADIKDSVTDASGYFAILIGSDDIKQIVKHRNGVFLAVLTNRGRRIYQDLKPRRLAKGDRISADVVLVRSEILEGGPVVQPPRPEPEPEPKKVKVPDVTGETEATAAQLLKRAGLKVGERTEKPTSDGVGIVVGQKPAAGTEVERNTAVDLEIGVTETVKVPKLVGVKENTARRRISESNLTVGKVRTEVGSRPGFVLEQDPEQGKEVPAGTAVDLVIATI